MSKLTLEEKKVFIINQISQLVQNIVDGKYDNRLRPNQFNFGDTETTYVAFGYIETYPDDDWEQEIENIAASARSFGDIAIEAYQHPYTVKGKEYIT